MTMQPSGVRAMWWSDVLERFARDGLPWIGDLVKVRMRGDVCDGITFTYIGQPFAEHTVMVPMLERAAMLLRAGPVQNVPEHERAMILEAERLSDARGVNGHMAVCIVETALFQKLDLSRPTCIPTHSQRGR